MQPSKETVKLGEDILAHYKPYVNTKTVWKKTPIEEYEFEMDERYEIVRVLGKGAYGVVAEATYKVNKDSPPQNFAIKKIQLAFQHKIYTRRTLRELKLLRTLRHKNVMGIETILLPHSRENYENIYIVSELMQYDLGKMIKGGVELTDAHKQFILYQLLLGLKYIHSANVLHRDLKPRNILINTDSTIKICDFGLARLAVQQSKAKANKMTNYVVTRWYRAPELLLSTGEYSGGVDIWSAGCIFGEMFRSKALFPGKDTFNQINQIRTYIQTPKGDDLKKWPQEARVLLAKQKQTKPLENLVGGGISPVALDLLKQMLQFDPAKRISVDDALKHPYFQKLDKTNLKVQTRPPIDPQQFEFQSFNFTMQQLKDLVYEQILLYHFKQFASKYHENIKNKVSNLQFVRKNSNATLWDAKTDDDDDCW